MNKVNTLTPLELRSHLQSRRPLLVLDLLPEETFAQRHIAGAQNACVYEMAFLDKVRAMLSRWLDASSST
jgi:hypothetical protein